MHIRAARSTSGTFAMSRIVFSPIGCSGADNGWVPGGYIESSAWRFADPFHV